VARSILRTAPGGAGCAVGRSVAFGARGSRVRRSGTSQVETVGLSWTTPLETVPIDRSPFWLVILGIRTRRSGTSRVKTVGLSWTTSLDTVPIARSAFWLVILVILQA